MHRVLSSLSLALCTACMAAESSAPGSEPPPQLVPSVGRVESVLVQPEVEEPPVAEPRTRAPWFDPIDPLPQRFPAYGLTQYHMAYVYEAPKKDARPIGYLRRGARFRASEDVGRAGCARGWFRVPGGGYVCASDGVTVDSRPPGASEGPTLPALSEPLPYRYAKVVASDVPQYTRVPTLAEEEATLATKPSNITLDDAGVPILEATPESGPVRLRMQPGFYVSVDREVESETNSHRFTRTVRGGHVRSEQLVDSKQPQGLGVALGNQHRLPLAFVYRGGAPALRMDPVKGEIVKLGPDVPLHSAHSLSGETVVRGARRYFVTREGLLLRDTSVRVVDRIQRPRQVPRGERWIRVDLSRQTLTAYEGETPVFATLVSSGLPDHATPAGIFRLHAKHVSTTMADDLAADGAYSIEDVPWTMYFLGSYALHAAFWHERFGHQRSHGCVNLAPRDARWLFFWTLPELPSSWHGIMAGVGEGTTVVLDTDVPYPIGG